MTFYCLFNYHSLVDLHYRDKLQKSQSARKWAREMGLSIREVEWHLNAKLFLDGYPRWEIDGPHQSAILHNMFLHAAKQGMREAERFIQWGCWQSLPRPDPEADIPAIKLVWYQTSHKEIRDLYHSIYILIRSPGLLTCGPWWREEVIQDILSSLRSHLHRWGYTTAPNEDLQGAAMAIWTLIHLQSWSRSRRNQHDEALWEAREAHQWALEAVHTLEDDIWRLSRGRGCPPPCLCSCSGSCPWSKFLDRHPRYPSWHRPKRQVTFGGTRSRVWYMWKTLQRILRTLF